MKTNMYIHTYACITKLRAYKKPSTILQNVMPFTLNDFFFNLMIISGVKG